ncbi:MAG TPA: DNA-binding response regulator [Nitrospiraceae bacterium]|nr:DNA-binding response regulator [Nitrospiraceae bacterium]
MEKPRILLADDHKIVLEGLRSLLEPEFDLVGTVEDGRALLAAAEKLRPDVVVVDITMPLLNGIDAVRQIKKKNQSIKIVFLTMHPDVEYAESAFEAGASGFVLKHSAPAELVEAIREAIKGRTYVTPMISDKLTSLSDSPNHEQNHRLGKLTARQREVLQLLAEGKSAKEVAAVLNISTRTVEFHKYHMMEELGIKTTAGLVRYAVKHRIVSL